MANGVLMQGIAGDSLYMGSVMAIRPKTGETVWHYQWTPPEPFDYEGINENMPADIRIDGQLRKVLLHADRNGFLYVLDRTDGTLIAGYALVKQNWAERIDPATGRPVFSDVTKRLRAGGTSERLRAENIQRGGSVWTLALMPE